MARERGHLPGRAAVREEGSASVLVLGIVAVLLVCAVTVAALAGASAARGTSEAAADLAALGAATAARDGTGDPCAVAQEVARRNGAASTTCSGEGAGVFTVQVQVSAPLGGTARAVARAGPASAAG